jgi:hypothetical protein
MDHTQSIIDVAVQRCAEAHAHLLAQGFAPGDAERIIKTNFEALNRSASTITVAALTQVR